MFASVAYCVCIKSLQVITGRLTRWLIGAGLIVFISTVTCVCGVGEAADIVSHRGVYNFTLKSSSSSSNVNSVGGGITFQWTDKCDHWEIRESYLLQVSRGFSHSVDYVAEYVGRESKDGLFYKFETKQRNLGKRKLIRGKAFLAEVGGSGVAQFESPERREVTLPSGTIFPAAHTNLLIDLSSKGQRFDRHYLFDGGEIIGAVPVFAVLLPERKPTLLPKMSSNSVESPLLLDTIRPITVAFYDNLVSDSPAKFEAHMEMQTNGVVTYILLHYTDFSVEGKLVRLEQLTEVGC